MSVEALPTNWSRATIGSLCTLRNGKAFKPSDWSESGTPIVRIQNLNNEDAKYNYYRGNVEEHFRIHGGNLLFAWSGTPGTSFGAHIWKGGDAVLNQHIFRVDFDETAIEKRFFQIAINQKLDELIGKAHGGVGLRHVTKGKFEETVIEVPPLSEQRRIVAKIDSLSGKSKRARDHLDHVPRLVERYKRAILTAAFAGTGRVPLGEVTDHIQYGYTAKSSPEPVGSKYLRITDVQHGAVDWSKVPYVAVTPEEVERFKLAQGDLVFARSGATVGKSFLIAGLPDSAVFASYMIRVRCDATVLIPQYASYFFQSGDYWSQIAEGSTGTGQPNFNGTKLANLQVPHASLSEQHETIRRVQSAFAWIDRLAAEATSARKLIDHLDQAILSKAFRGELVPQDPNDEPASVLLERIQGERAGATDRKSGRSKRLAIEAAS